MGNRVIRTYVNVTIALLGYMAGVGCMAHRGDRSAASEAPRVEQMSSLVRLALNDNLENRKQLVAQWQLEMTAYSNGSAVVATVLTRPGLAVIVLGDEKTYETLGIQASESAAIWQSVRSQLQALKSTAGSDAWQVVFAGYRPSHPASVINAMQDSLPRRNTFLAFASDVDNGAGSQTFTSAFNGSYEESSLGEYL